MSASDSYWFTYGGIEHKHRLFQLDDERNKQLARIAAALEALLKLQAAADKKKEDVVDQPTSE